MSGPDDGLADFVAALPQLGQYPAADIIGMLTGFAVDLRAHAQQTLDALLERLKQVDVTRKVPLLYLIDSVVKRERGATPLRQREFPFFFQRCSTPSATRTSCGLARC